MITLTSAEVTAPTPDGVATILHPTTLTLSESRIAIIGANGSGKSTLARLLNGLILPTSGTVHVATGIGSSPDAGSSALTGSGSRAGSASSTGSELSSESTWLDTARDGRAVRRSVGFVFTDPSAQLVMPTPLEDVALSLRAQYRRKEDRNRAALAVLERFGLESLADRSVHTLSGGQRQLLAIASVLAVDPTILVADEPTTLLDLRNSREIGRLLTSLPQQVIIVTHDLELAEQCDRALVIEDARVAFDGAPSEAVAWYRSRA